MPLGSIASAEWYLLCCKLVSKNIQEQNNDSQICERRTMKITFIILITVKACHSKMILLRKLNRRPNDVTFNLWKGEVWGFKVSWDDGAPLPRGIACATRSIRAPLNAGLMMDSSPPLPSLLDVWQPSTVSFTILYHGPCYQFIPVHSKSNYCLGTCFVFLRMETPLFRIVRFGAVCILISRQRPPTIASGIFPVEAQASSRLSSTSHHLISVSTSLLWNSQVKTEHLPPHFWDILISSTLPPPFPQQSGKLEKNKTCPF